MFNLSLSLILRQQTLYTDNSITLYIQGMENVFKNL